MGHVTAVHTIKIALHTEVRNGDRSFVIFILINKSVLYSRVHVYYLSTSFHVQNIFNFFIRSLFTTLSAAQITYMAKNDWTINA